jgi:hypothetical protein
MDLMFFRPSATSWRRQMLLCRTRTTSQVEASIAKLLPTMPRQATIGTSLQDRGAADQGCAVWAILKSPVPSRLNAEISAENPQQWAEQIYAGAMFLGASSESLGDYCCGPNHVLPTSRTARFRRRWGCTTSRSGPLFMSGEAARNPGPCRRHSGVWREACETHAQQRTAFEAAAMTKITGGQFRLTEGSCAETRWRGWRVFPMLSVDHNPDGSQPGQGLWQRFQTSSRWLTTLDRGVDHLALPPKLKPTAACISSHLALFARDFFYHAEATHGDDE